MKKLHILFLLSLCSFLVTAQKSQLECFFNTQTQIKSIEKIIGNDFFSETFKIMVRQPIDHSDTTKGFFLQRVFVADKCKSNPVLLITEGYGAGYAERPNYLNELSPMLNSNQICVEHRYFGKSWPDSVDWNFLTVENAAADHHLIVEMFKKYYSNKWINTGISKGGQTAVYHRTLYPADVDVTVAYVAPLNFGVEDGRHERFLSKVVGTAQQRKRIKSFQLNVLKNRKMIIPKLIEYSKLNNYNYRIPIDEVLDYCVLEYPFALWQWGKPTDDIPLDNATVDQLFNYLMLVSPPSYYAIEGMENIRSFFVQAARELGYYGYDTRPLKKFLNVKTTKNYINTIFLPENVNVKYVKETAQKVKNFIENTDENIIFIYGEIDPWSASAFEVSTKKHNLLKIINPGGCHLTRINNLPQYQQVMIKGKLESWLQIQLNLN